jgi:chaperone required for assembly of F1-ATPase
MSGWKAKRFWKEASVRAAPGGFSVWLDSRQLKTPAKAALVVPTEAMARAIAAEWQAQEAAIDPRTMPVTRAANAAIDKVAVQFDEVADLIAAYGLSDLLCYRAAGPEALAARQAEAWDPLLDWAARTLGARLVTTVGVIPVDQPEASASALSGRVKLLDAFRLTALHDLVSISGSLVLGLAVMEGRIDPETAWKLSRIDEAWQNELWGADDEAEAVAEGRLTDIKSAHNILKLLGR